MTIEEVRKRVSDIRDTVDDPETAHSAEDQLHQDVLQAIADGAAEPRLLARAALKTLKLEFSRWYA